MPVEGTKLAPKIFRGDPADVAPFLRRFERLALLHNLSDKEKCETVTDYCSKLVRETIEGFAAYRQGNWSQLKANIRVYWNADLESKRFRIRDLQAFTARSRKQPILELRDWRKYLRRFIRIAGWLQGQNKLSETDYAYYLWTGLSSLFRRRLEARLLMEDPNHDMSEPFDPEAIRKAAEALLGVDRFDTERLGTENWSDNDSDGESDDLEAVTGLNVSKNRKRDSRKQDPRVRDSDSDSEDSDLEPCAPRHRSPADRYPTFESHKASKPASMTGSKQKFEEDREFNQLVAQMQRMSLDDPQYGFLYLKVCSMRPLAAECLPKPIVNRSIPQQREMQRGLPPHMSRSNSDRFMSSRPPPRSGDGCFGCGEQGHIIHDCPAMLDFLKKGHIMKDYRGRFTRSDGSPLRRNPDETWVQAVKRTIPGVNLITFGGRVWYDSEVGTDTEDEDGADVMVYPVERSQRETRSYRKQVFDGVKVPHSDKGKQQDHGAQKNTTRPGRYPMPKLTPVETNQRSFNPNDDMDVEEDRTQVRNQPKPPQPPNPSSGSQSNLQQERERLPVRRSQLNREVDSEAILKKILDSPLTMSVREVVGVSKEVANRLQDVLKVKRAEFVQSPSTNLVTSATGSLIRLEMECNQHPVSFIVDTGSQLNIISEKVCKNIVRRPINTGQAISMNDANGGTGRLLGLVEDIPLKIGHVKTPINAFVAENPPFDGLLGRPWQLAHKIGIEEREDGTYLTFPSPPGFPKPELLVSTNPEPIGPLGVYSVIVKKWTANDPKPHAHDKEHPDHSPHQPEPEEEAQSCYGISSEDEEGYDGERTDDEDNSDSNEGIDAYLDQLIDGLAEEEENTSHTESETVMHQGIHQLLQADTPDIPSRSAGPCTIVSEMATEFANATPGLDTRVFLLRDARLFSRNRTHQGHMVVKIIPYTSNNLATFTPHAEETSQQSSVSMICVEQNQSGTSARTRQTRVLAPPPGLIMIPIRLGDQTIQFLLDTGSQINCIRTDIWRKLGGVTNGPTITRYISNATGERLQCHGTWRTTLAFGTISMIVDLLIVDNLISAGILGRPWQRQGHMWMEDTPEGVHLGIGSADRQHTYGMLITTPITQPNLRSGNAQAQTITEPQLEVPEMDYTETHRISALMDSSEPVVTRKDASPAPMVISSLMFNVEDPATWPSPWHLHLERGWYEQLLYQFRSVFRHQVAPEQPIMTSIDFEQAEKLALRDEWRTHVCREEELYLLKNVQVEVDGQLRRGHGVFQMVYFPEDHTRPTRKRHSSSSLELSDDEDRRPRKRTRPTSQDLEESMEEITYEMTHPEAYEGDIPGRNHARAPRRKLTLDNLADLKPEEFTHNIVAEEKGDTVHLWHNHQPWGDRDSCASGYDDIFTLAALKSRA